MNKEKQILTDTIMKRAANNMQRVENVITQIQTQDNNLTDTLVYSDQFEFKNNTAEQVVKLQFGNNEANIAKFAMRQLAGRFGVPTTYINKLVETEWGRDLSAHLFNEHTQNQDAQRLLIRNVDGQVRGVLSDAYKRLNSMIVFSSFMEAALESKAKIFDASIDETKSFIDIIRPEIIEIPTPKNGVVNIVLGAQIRNSDFGDGALNIRAYMLNVVCLNGLIGTKYLNEIHRGGKLPENIELSDRTYQLETEASASLVKDAIASIFNDNNIQSEIDRIINASNTEIDFDKKITHLKRSKHYSEFELQALSKKLIANNPDDGVAGKNTVWKFVQGLTSVANEYTTTRKNELIEYASALY